MAGIAFIVIFAIAVLPIFRIARFPLSSSEKFKYCIIANLVSPPVVTVGAFLLSRNMASDTKEIVMQFTVASYFGPWVIYSRLKRNNNLAMTMKHQAITPNITIHWTDLTAVR